MSNCNFCKLH